MFVLRFENDTAGVLSLKQGFANRSQHTVLHFRVFVIAHLGDFLHTLDAILHRLEVFELQLGVDDFFVANRIHTSVDMHHIAVVETAQHVDNGVGLADIAEKLVAEPLTLRGALHQTGDVYDFYRGGNDFIGFHQRGQRRKALIGYSYDAHIGFDGAKGEVGTLCLGVAQTVEERRFAHIGQADDAAL